MPLTPHIAGWAATLLIALATPAWAQLGPLQRPSLPALPAGGIDRPSGFGAAERLGQRALDDVLRAPRRLTGFIRRSDGALQADPDGWPVVAGEIVAVDLSDDARRRALDAGFMLLREERLEALDLATVVLSPPRRLSLPRAVERLRDLDPGAEVTFNHVYAPAGAGAGDATAATSHGFAPRGSQGDGVRLGLIDTGVAAAHPALAGSSITQRGFAGPARVGAHGTAVASLMVGRGGSFSGADPGRALLVADIYGGQVAGGSSTGLAQALAWMVEQSASVVNVSLVGPRNALVERAVARAQARGVTIVAAVGNDGPAAAILFPAAYPEVIGVTAVGARNQALPEAARGPQVDFAAPGADMAAAGPDGGFVTVRGASFAAPLVAGLIARGGGGPRAVEALSRSATDLGARGRDPIYGRGLVAADLRVEPGAVGARRRLGR